MATTHLEAAVASSFRVTPWGTCVDYPQFECRNITVPYSYEPETLGFNATGSQLASYENGDGTVNNRERWLVSGTPEEAYLAAFWRVRERCWIHSFPRYYSGFKLLRDDPLKRSLSIDRQTALIL